MISEGSEFIMESKYSSKLQAQWWEQEAKSSDLYPQAQSREQTASR